MALVAPPGGNVIDRMQVPDDPPGSRKMLEAVRQGGEGVQVAGTAGSVRRSTKDQASASRLSIAGLTWSGSMASKRRQRLGAAGRANSASGLATIILEMA